jgi:hypothetical protein
VARLNISDMMDPARGTLAGTTDPTDSAIITKLACCIGDKFLSDKGKVLKRMWKHGLESHCAIWGHNCYQRCTRHALVLV